jgi:hypothetical protein
MPVISRFLGLVVSMNYDDHNPPHFHVRYGDHEAVFTISPCNLLAGRLPPRSTKSIQEWAGLHSAELLRDWERARSRLPLAPIEPLE